MSAHEPKVTALQEAEAMLARWSGFDWVDDRLVDALAVAIEVERDGDARLEELSEALSALREDTADECA